MPIGTSDGKMYESELDYQLGNHIQVQDLPTRAPMPKGLDQPYDDSSSFKQKLFDELDMEKPTVSKFKELEMNMEGQQILSDKTYNEDVNRLDGQVHNIGEVIQLPITPGPNALKPTYKQVQQGLKYDPKVEHILTPLNLFGPNFVNGGKT